MQGAKYNIPVSLWLPESYPQVPPIMYVVPTPDMIIKPRHPFVDASGLVSTPYIRNWVSPHSTLMIMCNDISIQFGQDPPLFSKPSGWVPPAPPQRQQSPHQQPSPAQTSSAHQPAQSPLHHTFQAENPMNRCACDHQVSGSSSAVQLRELVHKIAPDEKRQEMLRKCCDSLPEINCINTKQR